VVIPSHLLGQYADVEVIRRHYPSMARWINYMAGFLTDDLMPRDTYGDWCVPPEDPKLIHSQDPLRKTAPTVLGTTHFFRCLQLAARYAELLDQREDAQRYRALAAKLQEAFHKKYFRPEQGWYDNGSQTSCILPLAFDMVPADQCDRVFNRLTDKIANESKNHVGTGLVGGQWLMRTLTRFGRADLAYTLASQRTYPSWGYMIDKGATTVWELWNGDTADPAMNSGNHVMLVGDLIVWLHEHLAGIKPDPRKPGFKHILMRPEPVGDLQFVKAVHRSPYGLISSHWRKQAEAFHWQITIPPNASATVYVRAKDRDSVTESGQPARAAEGVTFLWTEPGYAVFQVRSGQYSFQSR
jgi:alpha-L-rhamnosidase